MHFFKDTSVARLTGMAKGDFNSIENQADRPPKTGSGDYYGTGSRNALSKIRAWAGPGTPVPREHLNTPPRSLA